MLRQTILRFICVKQKRVLHRIKYHDMSEIIVTVSQLQMKQTLKSNNVMFVEGHACLIANCPFCQSTTARKDSKIFINKTTGYFICESCRYSGPWNILEKFIRLKKNGKTFEEAEIILKSLQSDKWFEHDWQKLKKNLEPISNLSPKEYSNMLQTFCLPEVAQNTLSQLSCIYDNANSLLYFPLIAFGSIIAGLKSIASSSESESTQPASNVGGVILFRQKGMRSDDTAVLVLTVRDLLALVYKRVASTVICLPYGLQSLPQQVLPSLEIYKKLILWFGNDEPSWYTARHFAKKLSDKRCYFVRPVDLQPRPIVAMKFGYDLKDIIQKAQPIWHKSITTFQSLRQDVLSDLQNIDKAQGVKWKRYPSLNRILKGHRRGEFTILTGPTGSGKTTFMSEYSLDLAMQGISTLWGSFEIRNARLAKTMLQQMAGMPLDQNITQFDVFADAFEKLPIYFMTFHGQQSVKVVMEAVEHATYVHDIAHVIIDNVQFMMGISDEPKHMDRFWKQDKIVASFRTFATKYNCHVTLVIHPRKEREDEELTTASIFGGAKASQEADNVLIIQDKRLTSIRGKKYLQIAKNRYSGDLGVMALNFDKDSLSYAPKKKSKQETEDKDEIFKN